MPARDPANFVLRSEEATRRTEAKLLFRRGTIRVVHGAAIAAVFLLVFWAKMKNTALVTPVSPDFRALLIGVGVFLGVLLAVVEREGWQLGIGGGRFGPPSGILVPFSMLVIVVASGFGGNFVAAAAWEWQAFHGLRGPVKERIFTVAARHSTRRGEWLDLQTSPSAASISINCSFGVYEAVQPGDRLLLSVETGRGGVQRVALPPVNNLRRV